MEIIESETVDTPSQAVYKELMHKVDAAKSAGKTLDYILLTEEEGIELCTYLAAVGLATVTVADLSDPEKEVRPYGGVRVVVA